MNDNDNINDTYAGVDAASAKASNIKLPTNLQSEHLNSFLIAEAEAKAQAAKIREMHAAKLAPVEPGKMAKRGQPDIPYYGSLCAVSKCRGLSEGGYVTIQPQNAYRDPIMNPEPVSDDWETEAFNQAEETRLRALGYSTDLLTQIEQAQRFVGPAQPATQFIATVVLALCPFHAENRDATIQAGFKANALPKFGHQ
jgi:hypothetical protein